MALTLLLRFWDVSMFSVTGPDRWTVTRATSHSIRHEDKEEARSQEASKKCKQSITSHFLTFSCKFQARARFIFDYVQLCSTLAIYSFLMLGEFEIVYIKCGRAKMRASHNGLREFLCKCC